MIIDSHVHVGRSDKISVSLTFFQLKKIMHKYGIFQSVVMPNISSEDSCIERNNIMLKDISDMKQDDKDYFIPYAGVDINHNGYIEHLEDIMDKIHGVKYHPSISQIAIDDERAIPASPLLRRILPVKMLLVEETTLIPFQLLYITVEFSIVPLTTFER